jgi:hypothetical protein
VQIPATKLREIGPVSQKNFISPLNKHYFDKKTFAWGVFRNFEVGPGRNFFAPMYGSAATARSLEVNDQVGMEW